MAVGSASPAMTTGSRRSRAASLGEYDDVWIWAATKTAENTIPVKVIMPPASAPKMAWTAVMAIGRLSRAPMCWSRIGRARASPTARTLAPSTGTHIAELSQILSRNSRPAARTSWCAWRCLKS